MRSRDDKSVCSLLARSLGKLTRASENAGESRTPGRTYATSFTGAETRALTVLASELAPRPDGRVRVFRVAEETKKFQSQRSFVARSRAMQKSLVRPLSRENLSGSPSSLARRRDSRLRKSQESTRIHEDTSLAEISIGMQESRNGSLRIRYVNGKIPLVPEWVQRAIPARLAHSRNTRNPPRADHSRATHVSNSERSAERRAAPRDLEKR